MANCDFLRLVLSGSADYQLRLLNSPHTAKANQRNSGCWHGTSFAYLVKQRSTSDKVEVATEWHEALGLWWSLRTF